MLKQGAIALGLSSLLAFGYMKYEKEVFNVEDQHFSDIQNMLSENPKVAN